MIADNHWRVGLRLKKLANGLFTPDGRRALRLKVAMGIEHRRQLAGLAVRTVVDVGANRGQFALLARRIYPDARIIAFEPLPGPAAAFRRLFAGDSRVSLHGTALGSQASEAEINITEPDGSSSLLAIGSKQLEVFGTPKTRSIKIPVARLDATLTAADLTRPTLLKIDVQGYEFEVLAGCGDLLERFDHVYAELSYVELYEKQPLASAVIDFLLARGFRLTGVFNQTSADGAALQADFLFSRAS